jgi:hypothetical protein
MMAAPTTSAGQHRWPELALFRKLTLRVFGAPRHQLLSRALRDPDYGDGLFISKLI